MATRIAVVGAAGQLGSDLASAIESRRDVAIRITHADLDVVDAGGVREALRRVSPDVVVNTAAFHDLEACHDDPSRAFAVNATGAANVAAGAGAVGARHLFISTDYVFPGTKPPPRTGETDPEHAYAEDEDAAPLNVYAASKLAGEALAASACADTLVVRVASLYGALGSRVKRGTFLDKILEKARSGSPISVVDDQWMTPTYTRHAAEAVADVAKRPLRGRIHVTSPDSCTWHSFASFALAVAGLDVRVSRARLDDYPSKVRRPRNASLNTDRLRRERGALPPWQKGVEEFLIEKGLVPRSAP
ncbi:MAG: dTDP-4-dehydrorhamnose reductase [Methanobacteriota archaeon]